MLPILLATYGAVFVAEIVGDKLLYTTGVLATRYRTAPIMFGMAIAFALWRKPDRKESKKEYPASRAMMVSFAAIFFSEWGDIGQITAATMAARFGAPLLVWIGAVCAMVTKGALAVSIGAGVR